MSDPKEIVNTLNEYFASVGPYIAERIQAVQGDIPDDVSNDAVRNDDSFHFDNVEPDYVMDLLNSMHENKVTGTDEIPAKLLKISADEIVLPLTYLVNLSLTTGTFPSQWKKARICPILKKVTALSLVIIDQFLSCQCYRRLLNVLFSIRCILFWTVKL